MSIQISKNKDWQHGSGGKDYCQRWRRRKKSKSAHNELEKVDGKTDELCTLHWKYPKSDQGRSQTIQGNQRQLHGDKSRLSLHPGGQMKWVVKFMLGAGSCLRISMNWKWYFRMGQWEDEAFSGAEKADSQIEPKASQTCHEKWKWYENETARSWCWRQHRTRSCKWEISLVLRNDFAIWRIKMSSERIINTVLKLII